MQGIDSQALPCQGARERLGARSDGSGKQPEKVFAGPDSPDA